MSEIINERVFLRVYGSFAGKYLIRPFQGKLRKIAHSKTEPVNLQFIESNKHIPAFISKSEETIYMQEDLFSNNLDKLKCTKLIRVSILNPPIPEVKKEPKETIPLLADSSCENIDEIDVSIDYVYCVECGKLFKGPSFQTKCRLCRMKAIQDEDISSVFFRNVSPKRTGRQMVYRYYGPAGDSL